MLTEQEDVADLPGLLAPRDLPNNHKTSRTSGSSVPSCSTSLPTSSWTLIDTKVLKAKGDANVHDVGPRRRKLRRRATAECVLELFAARYMEAEKQAG